MIYVTGDTHGYIDFPKLLKFKSRHKGLTINDYVIIAGDFGGLWAKETLAKDLKRYDKLPFTLLFVDGNHENFKMLNSYPVEMWNGGKVHKITPKLIHLMRGQVFEIDGNTIFTFGGATSVDRDYRIKNHSWWEEEVPTFNELDEGIENLKKYNNEVDYIITHSCSEKTLKYPPLCERNVKTRVYDENRMLSYIEDVAIYKHWYFGHYHMDYDITNEKTIVYKKIIKLPNKK